MSAPHPHKALIDAITSGAAVETYRLFDTPPYWQPATADKALACGGTFGWNSVRLKPAKTHHEKTVRYPVPMQVMPNEGEMCFMVFADGPAVVKWHSDDRFWGAAFNAGLCYEIHREAEAREAWEARFGEGWK